MACQTLNGQESAAKEMIQKIVADDREVAGIKRRTTTLDGAQDGGMTETVEKEGAEDTGEVSADEEAEDLVNGLNASPPSVSTRSKAKQRS